MKTLHLLQKDSIVYQVDKDLEIKELSLYCNKHIHI